MKLEPSEPEEMDIDCICINLRFGKNFDIIISDRSGCERDGSVVVHCFFQCHTGGTKSLVADFDGTGTENNFVFNVFYSKYSLKVKRIAIFCKWPNALVILDSHFWPGTEKFYLYWIPSYRCHDVNNIVNKLTTDILSTPMMGL